MSPTNEGENKPPFFILILVCGALAFSLRFAKSANAASSPTPVKKVISSSQMTLLNATGKLDSNNPSSGMMLNQQESLSKNKDPVIPKAKPGSRFSSSKSEVYGTQVVESPPMVQDSIQKSGEARSLLAPVETSAKDIFDLLLKNKNEGDLERNNLKTNNPEVTDTLAQDVLCTTRDTMMNFNLPTREEIPEIIHAIDRFDFPLMKKKMFFQTCKQDGFHFITAKNEVNEKELDLFKQKTRVLRYLLLTPFKENNSIIKKVGHFIDVTFLSSFQDKEIDGWYPWYKKEYSQAMNYIRLVAADGLEAASDQLYNYPLCPLPFDVIIELSSYLEKMHKKTDQIFRHYWINRDIEDLIKLRSTPYVQLNSLDGPRSPYYLLEAALVDAVHLVMEDSLIDHYNSKHKTDYKLEYIKRTGIEPRLPRNRMSQIQRETQYILAKAPPIIDPDAPQNEGFL